MRGSTGDLFEGTVWNLYEGSERNCKGPVMISTAWPRLKLRTF